MDVSRSDLEHEHRVCRSTAALRGATGVQDPQVPGPRHLGKMRVAVNDGVASRKRRGEPLASTSTRAGSVKHPDPRAGDLEDTPLGQDGKEFGAIHVPGHRFDRRQGLKLLEHRRSNDVAGVEDQIRALEQSHTFARKPPLPAGHVSVGDDGDAGRRASARAVEKRAVAVEELAVRVDLAPTA